MRYLLCLIGGILLGGMLALTVANALQRRNAWPRALMNVMQHELGSLRDSPPTGPCGGTEAQSSLAHLALLSGDIQHALLAPGTKDAVFVRYANDLRETITKAQGVGADCPRQSAAVTDISNACDACHRDYR